MAIDFIPLPMTELRNRPGEILDRVSDDGVAFVIERNGRQKACLVPLSLFLPDVSPARIARELDELDRAGEASCTTITDAKEIAIKFDETLDNDSIEITIVLPHEYPNACPRVYATPIDSRAPHRFADGALCIFGSMSSWNPGRHSARTTLEDARRWLDLYGRWRTTGHWHR